ncbi:FAD-dependent oxidoreductase [Pseudoxanthobacter sp. M-2]|uniref:oxidoreductase n=1 Tax=Pseudoxanthobacter sp. M-2 TaxID=3078754 RepID=UPI0038FC33EB
MSRLFTHLFSPLTIRGVEVRNRILSTGHHTLLARDGKAPDELVAYHEARARGGAGLIVLECTAVHETAFFHGTCLNGFTDDCIPGFRKLAEVIHANGAKTFGQLFHPGCEVMGIASDGTRTVAYAPSAVKHERYLTTAVPMSGALIADVIACYGATAARMIEAGLDGVEVMASHGYLPSQFLNPRINRREDEWGGSFHNRIRFLREIVAAVRAAIGPGPVVGLRISGDEEDARGLHLDECLAAVDALHGERAFDYYNVTAGSSSSAKAVVHIVPPMSFAPAYVAPYARKVRDRVDVPVFVVGRINQPHEAETVIRNGDADMCGMTRAMISDPEMPRKAREDRTDDIRACVACNQACIGHLYLGAPVSCIQRPETGRERRFGSPRTAATVRRVAVVGGGPAGMKAAAAAAERGHHVTLFEAGRRLGGQVLYAQMLPGRAEFGGVVTNLAREVERAQVRVELGVRATAADIVATGADAVIVATGATPMRPDLELSDGRAVYDAWQVLDGEAPIGRHVAIADWRGDWVGMGLAERFVREGRQVTLATSTQGPAVSLMPYIRDQWVSLLQGLGVRFVSYARPYGADAADVYFEHTYSGEAIVVSDADTFVVSYGNEPRPSPFEGDDLGGATVRLIGDAASPRTVEEAVLEGLVAADAIGRT